MRGRSLVLVIAASLIAAASCRDPTEVLVVARSNVPYAAGRAVSFTVGAPGEVEGADPTTQTDGAWSGDTVGTLGVVPSAAKDGELAVKVVLGVTKDPRDCSIASPDGCIIARRRLRYVPHATLRLPVTLYAQCVGVACDANTTCNALGQCVGAEVDPATCDSAAGCAVPGDAPPGGPVDGGLVDGAASDEDGSAATDAGAEAAADAAADAARPDGGTPGVVDCPGAGTCLTSQGCCTDLVTNGTCTPAACAGTVVACDGDEDCPPGGVCCRNGNSLMCQVAPCPGGTEEVCHSGAGCTLGFLCSPNGSGYYEVCK